MSLLFVHRNGGDERNVIKSIPLLRTKMLGYPKVCGKEKDGISQELSCGIGDSM